MRAEVTIGIIGDYDGRISHVATNDAIAHAAAALAITADARWLPTAQLLSSERETVLTACDALWASPGSPYQSMDGALLGIRFARERDWPFLGT
jgi:CTP synthase (UTP-ammonia lyase)